MKRTTKLLIALVGLGVAGFVGVRELRSSCVPPTKADAHGHSHGESEQHAREGFGTRVCEVGVLSAVVQTLGLSGTSEATKPHRHATGDGHAHDEKEEADGTAAIKDDGHGHSHSKGAGGDSKAAGEGEGFVKLSAAQIEAAEIATAPVTSGQLVKEIAVPGWILVNGNAQAKIVPKLSGTAARIDKQLGDSVKAGDLLLALESREIAEAKAEYLAAWRAEELARSVLDREERLWTKKVTAEQDYLNARNGQQAAQIKLDLAHQKLHALGLDEDGIAALPKLKDETAYRLYEIRSPIDGRVTARDVVLGQIVGADKEVFAIADLSKVWVELAVPSGDLALVREGQEVRVAVGSRIGAAKVIALSPGINPETRSAKVIAELDNAGGEWQPGDYANTKLVSSAQDVKVLVPRTAIQTVNSKPSVFVGENGGFRAQAVTTGRSDSVNVEILSGIEPGQIVATSGTFTLKAELGKSEAEHEH